MPDVAVGTISKSDYDEIRRILHLYTDGFGAGDINMFKEAFHEDAWIFFTLADGTLVKSLIADLFEEWARPPKVNIACRVIEMRQAGDIANVWLGFDNTDDVSNSWVDFHNLIRIDGVWKITNKTATHASRAK